jgi:hypothetical protein
MTADAIRAAALFAQLSKHAHGSLVNITREALIAGIPPGSVSRVSAILRKEKRWHWRVSNKWTRCERIGV